MRLKSIACLAVMTSVIFVGALFTGYEAEASEKIEIVIWHTISEGRASPRGQWLFETADEYEKKHPNVDVVLEATPGIEMIVMLQTAAAAHRGADAVSIWTGDYLFPFEEFLLDVKGYFSAEEISGWRPSVMISGYYDYDTAGRLLGIPDSNSGVGFYHIVYNQAMFSEAGVSPPTKATDYRWTWEEFTAACDKLKAVGITPLGWGNRAGQATGWRFFPQLLQTFEEGDFFRMHKREMAVNDPKIVEPLGRINDLYQAGYYNEGGLTLGWTEGLNLLRNRKVAMQHMYWGPVEKETYRELGEDFGMMKVPVFNPDGPLTYRMMGGVYSTFTIPEWTKYPEETAEWLKFFGSKERLDKLYEMAGLFPGRADFDTSLIKNRWDRLAWEWISEGPLQSDSTFMGNEVFYEMCTSSMDMYLGKITPQEVGDRMQEIFEELDYPWLTEAR